MQYAPAPPVAAPSALARLRDRLAMLKDTIAFLAALPRHARQVGDLLDQRNFPDDERC